MFPRFSASTKPAQIGMIKNGRGLSPPPPFGRLDRHVRHFDHDFWQQECAHLVLRGSLAKFPQNEKMRLALVHTGQRRLPEASPHDKVRGMGLSACHLASTNASTIKCATLTTASGKNIAKISSCEATLRDSNKNMRYALPLDTLANAALPKPALMISCSASASAFATCAPLPLILGFKSRARNPSRGDHYATL